MPVPVWVLLVALLSIDSLPLRGLSSPTHVHTLTRARVHAHMHTQTRGLTGTQPAV